MKQLEKIVDEEIWENEAGGSREKMKCKLSTQHTMYFLNSNAGIKTLVRKKNVLPTSRQLSRKSECLWLSLLITKKKLPATDVRAEKIQPSIP